MNISIPKHMHAVALKGHGGPDVLQLVDDAPVPVPGPGELLIQVAASGVNRPDVLQRLGQYPVPPGASELPGLEVAGVVAGGDARALADAGIAVGDHVCALVAGGGYAQWCVAPVGQCLPVPAGWTDIEAASLPETGFTVWSNVFDRARLQPGETLLIQGGSSGIGVTAIQFARAHGAKVIVTAGSDEKCAACVALGADAAINYRTHDFSAEVLRLTDGRGADVILDMVAGSYIPRELACLADDGRLVIIAVQGGREATVDCGAILRRRLTVCGSTLRPRPIAFKTAIARSLRERVWPWLEARQVQPVVFRVFAPSQAAASHVLMESNAHVGKLVIDWSRLGE